MTLSTTDSLAVYLASLSAPDLAHIVTTSPTVPDEPRPTTLRHVAVCLADAETALLACSFISQGEFRLLEALWAVADERPPGGSVHLGREAAPRLDDDPVVLVDPDTLTSLFGGADHVSPEDVGALLGGLTGRVLAWPEDGRIRLHPGTASVFPLPLGLGAPAYALLLGQRPDELQVIVRELGGIPAGHGDDNVLLAARLLADPVVVRRVASRLDPAARAALDELTSIGVRREQEAAWGPFGSPANGSAGTDAFSRLRRRGLLLPTGDGWEMTPREVALALRGDDYRAPFEARPPRVVTVPSDHDLVSRASSASAADALDIVARLMRVCAVAPPRLPESGGVGARETHRLARALRCDEGAVRLWLHVAEAAGLLLADAGRGRMLPTREYDAWLEGEPAARLLALVRGWVAMPDVPTLDAARASATPGERPPAPLRGASAHGGLALVARGALLRTLGAQAPDRAVADVASLARCVAWVCPTPFRQSLVDLVEEVHESLTSVGTDRVDAGLGGVDGESDGGLGKNRDGAGFAGAGRVRLGPAVVDPGAGVPPQRVGDSPVGGATPRVRPVEAALRAAGSPADRLAGTNAPPGASDAPDEAPAPALVGASETSEASRSANTPDTVDTTGTAKSPEVTEASEAVEIPETAEIPEIPGPGEAPRSPETTAFAGASDASKETGAAPAAPCACADCRETADGIEAAYEGRFDALAFTVTALREAAALGLVAGGALTALGRGVVARQGTAALLATAGRLLPPLARRALFRADLTAVVSGTPAAGLARLLDGCADADGAGGVWRFSEPSVRRHLDAGGGAARLLSDLAEAAIGGLPEPFADLIHGVGLRHGLVRATSVPSVVHCRDETLIAELVGHQGLDVLGWRRVAPTVLVSAEPLDRVLRCLRRFGYAPVAETENGHVAVERPVEYRADEPNGPGGPHGSDERGESHGFDRREVPDSRPVVPPLSDELPYDWRTWAAGLLDGAKRSPPPLGAKASRLHEAAPLLGPEDCLVLADALDRGTAVRVAATAYDGEPLTGTVAHLAMAGDSLYLRPPDGRPALLPFRLETLWLVLPAER